MLRISPKAGDEMSVARQIQAISAKVDQSAAQSAPSKKAPAEPSSQRFQMLPPTNVASTTASSSWATIDLTEIVPTDAAYFEGFAVAIVNSGSYNGTFEIRQSEGASTYTALRVYSPSGFAAQAFNGLFHIPLTLSRTFQYRFSTTDSDVSLTVEARGYWTSPVRSGDEAGKEFSGGADGGSGPGAESGGGAGLRGGGETSTTVVATSAAGALELG